MEGKKTRGNSIKIVILIVIIIVLLLIIAGMFIYYNNHNRDIIELAKKARDETNMVREQEEKKVNKVNKIDETKDLVYTSYNKMISNSSYSIPFINIKSDEVDKINQEIEEKYKTESSGAIKYTSYLNDNILSLVITELTPSDTEYFNIYNVDVYKGKKVNNATLIAKKNITESNFLAKLKSAHKKGFENMWGTKEECLNRFSEVLTGEAGAKLYDELLNKTISNKNYSVKDTPMFLGNNGKINIIANIYAFTGPESLNNIVEVDI